MKKKENKTIRYVGLVFSISFLISACQTQYLEKDPPHGTIPTGQSVYVDDGYCPKGEVKRVVGGSATMERKITCVPKRE